MRFFIIGCQRSGTNLMRLIVDSHPDIWCFGEGTSYYLLEHNHLDSIKESYDYWIESSGGSAQATPDIWPNKNPLHFGYAVPGWTELFVEYNCIKKYLAIGNHLIFMTRNPLDVISSIYFHPDLEEHTIIDMKTWLKDEGRRLKKYENLMPLKQKLSRLEKTKWFAVYWKYKTEIYFDMIEHNYKVIDIQYESLVKSPQKTINTVMQFLQIPWHEDLLQHHQKPHSETNLTPERTHITMGDTAIDRKIDTASVNQYKSILGNKEIQIIMDIAGELMEKLGYL